MRTHPVLSLFAAALIAIVPTQALAQTPAPTPETPATTTPAPTPAQTEITQPREEVMSVRERPRADYDPLGMRLGAFNLAASLDFEVASTDNLFADVSGGEESDLYYTISPEASLSSDWSRHAVGLDVGAAFTRFSDFESEDADEHFVRLRGRLDVAESTAINASARYGHEVTPRSDPDFDPSDPQIEFDRTDLQVGVTHRLARGRLSADLIQSEVEHDSAAQAFRDYESTTLRARGEYDIAPRLALLVQASGDERDYSNTPGLSSEGRTVLVGGVFTGDLFRGELSVGQFEREYNDPALGTSDGVAVSGELEWYATRLTTVTFDARRDADDNVGASVGAPYITSEAGVSVDHELRRNVILSAGASAGEREYETIDRSDEFTGIELGADYILNRRVALRARYEFYQNDSVGSDPSAVRDYDVNTVSVGLTLRL